MGEIVVTIPMAEKALKVFNEKKANVNPLSAMLAALEAMEGTFEQKFANEQVKQGRAQGSCPTCGGEM